MKKIINLTIMLFALLTATNFSFAQDKAETEKITKYLESTIEYRSRLIVTSALQKVLASNIIKSELTFKTKTDQKSRMIIQEQYFIKSGNKLTPYKTLNDMLLSSEFIESIKIKKFNLITDENVLAFQGMLRFLDRERGLGYFKENNIWYFIRSKFFDDVKAFVVTTDKKGQIASVVYEKKLRKEVPKTLQQPVLAEMAQAAEMAAVVQSGEIEQDMDLEKYTISKKDSTYMHNYLLDDLNYVFEISPSLNSASKISTISIYKCSLKITDENSIGRHPFLLVANNDEYIKQSKGVEVVTMPLFLTSLQEKYKIETEEDARLFMNLLDDLEQFKNFHNNLKTFYKKENVWIFVRKKRFDDLKGYILIVDKKYRVSYIEYTTISDENIVRIKKKDPNFKVN